MDKTDKNSFLFNLQSNGRISKPMKFEIIDSYRGGYYFWNNLNDRLLTIGDIILFREEMKGRSCCMRRNENYFDYHDT